MSSKRERRKARGFMGFGSNQQQPQEKTRITVSAVPAISEEKPPEPEPPPPTDVVLGIKPREGVKQRKNPIVDPSAILFTPYAWSKLLYFRDAGPTEVGGFGVAEDVERPLLITDFAVVHQECTWAFTSFDEESVDDHYDSYRARLWADQQFGRVWIHTHPGDSPDPSMVDEKTFRTRFGDADWAVMFILARGGQSYARLRTSSVSGFTINTMLDVDVIYSAPYPAAEHRLWSEEYKEKVREEKKVYTASWPQEKGNSKTWTPSQLKNARDASPRKDQEDFPEPVYSQGVFGNYYGYGYDYWDDVDDEYFVPGSRAAERARAAEAHGIVSGPKEFDLHEVPASEGYNFSDAQGVFVQCEISDLAEDRIRDFLKQPHPEVMYRSLYVTREWIFRRVKEILLAHEETNNAASLLDPGVWDDVIEPFLLALSVPPDRCLMIYNICTFVSEEVLAPLIAMPELLDDDTFINLVAYSCSLRVPDDNSPASKDLFSPEEKKGETPPAAEAKPAEESSAAGAETSATAEGEPPAEDNGIQVINRKPLFNQIPL